jgi:hypothetical protein
MVVINKHRQALPANVKRLAIDCGYKQWAFTANSKHNTCPQKKPLIFNHVKTTACRH